MTNVLMMITIPTIEEELRSHDGFNIDFDMNVTEKVSSRKNRTVSTKSSIMEFSFGSLTPRSMRGGQSQKSGRGTNDTQRQSVKTSNLDESSIDAVTVNSDVANSAHNVSWDRLRELVGPSKRKLNRKTASRELMLDLPLDTSLEVVLREILKKFQIQNVFWAKDIEGRMLEAKYVLAKDETYENLLKALSEWGIGERTGTIVSTMSCVPTKHFEYKEEFSSQLENAKIQSTWNRFMNSVQSRLNVNQIVYNVVQEAGITFDFMVLLIAAAILAGFGLVENSNIFLTSSMLISPLMGPIIAGIFGTVIKDNSLRWLGLKNELVGVSLAFAVGIIFGCIVSLFDEHFIISSGLTEEMLSRCEIRSLIIGSFTALVSGAAGAIGILGGNTGSLVGVAISASLLPPAVNSGLLWALALSCQFWNDDGKRFSSLLKKHFYSSSPSLELIVMATISFGLTILNVICVYVMGVIVLRVKEIAPSIGNANRSFWKHDIKIARNMTKSGFDTDTGKAIMREYEHLPQEDQNVLGLDKELVLNFDDSLYQRTWSPATRCELQRKSLESNYHTVHGIEKLYSSIQTKSLPRERISHQRRLTGNDKSMTHIISVMELFKQHRSDVDSNSNQTIEDGANTAENTTTTSAATSTTNTVAKSNFDVAALEYGTVDTIANFSANTSTTSSVCIIDEGYKQNLRQDVRHRDVVQYALDLWKHSMPIKIIPKADADGSAKDERPSQSRAILGALKNRPHDENGGREFDISSDRLTIEKAPKQSLIENDMTKKKPVIGLLGVRVAARTEATANLNELRRSTDVISIGRFAVRSPTSIRLDNTVVSPSSSEQTIKTHVLSDNEYDA